MRMLPQIMDRPTPRRRCGLRKAALADDTGAALDLAQGNPPAAQAAE